MSQNLLLIIYKKASKNGNLNVPLHDVKHPKFFLQKPIKIWIVYERFIGRIQPTCGLNSKLKNLQITLSKSLHHSGFLFEKIEIKAVQNSKAIRQILLYQVDPASKKIGMGKPKIKCAGRSRKAR